MILSDLNERETKFKEHNKNKSSNFIAALKLNSQYYDRKGRFIGVWIL